MLRGVTEMTQVTEGMKADQVGAEHPGNQFTAAGVTTENLIGRKGCVQEKPNPQVGAAIFSRAGRSIS
jgi:hypothetical protein